MIDTLNGLVQTGVVRRYGALVSHRRLGFTANAMLVMAIPPEQIEAAGARLAESPHVSHCYQRPPFDDFPYNLYAMVHGRTRDECLDIAAGLVGAHRCPLSGNGAPDWQALFSTREYGKSSPDYARLLEDRTDMTRRSSP
jgi:DNA-binding Lrp family transcriptional regulator